MIQFRDCLTTNGVIKEDLKEVIKKLLKNANKRKEMLKKKTNDANDRINTTNVD